MKSDIKIVWGIFSHAEVGPLTLEAFVSAVNPKEAKKIAIKHGIIRRHTDDSNISVVRLTKDGCKNYLEQTKAEIIRLKRLMEIFT